MYDGTRVQLPSYVNQLKTWEKIYGKNKPVFGHWKTDSALTVFSERMQINEMSPKIALITWREFPGHSTGRSNLNTTLAEEIELRIWGDQGSQTLQGGGL